MTMSRIARSFLLAGCSALATSAGAQLPTPRPPDTVFLEELTWDELQLLMKGGKTTAIIGTAGTEQKGPHMAIAEHKYAITYTSDKIARALGNAIVAPIITYVPEGSYERPTGHMARAGSITLPEERFRGLLEVTARSLKSSGFTEIILIGDSGGNQGGMRFVADKLNGDSSFKAAGVRLHFIGDYYAKAHSLQDTYVIDSLKLATRETMGGHANLLDTSELLYIHPELINKERMATAAGKDGSSGDPAKSTPQLGKKFLDMKIELALAQIKQSLEIKR
jgi:creatinine amidohydrolase/Fe(II)-dependent formamide hydrolase-like protein